MVGNESGSSPYHESMSDTLHICSRCGRTSDEPGACPSGHGWLLDLVDMDDREELLASEGLLAGDLSPRHLFGQLVAIEVIAALLVASANYGAELERFRYLWNEGGIFLLLAQTALVVALGFGLLQVFSPKRIRLRRISRALRQTAELAPPRPAALTDAADPDALLPAVPVSPDEEGRLAPKPRERSTASAERHRIAQRGAVISAG